MPAVKFQQPFYASWFKFCIKYRWTTLKRIIYDTHTGGWWADKTGAISHGLMQMRRIWHTHSSGGGYVGRGLYMQIIWGIIHLWDRRVRISYLPAIKVTELHPKCACETIWGGLYPTTQVNRRCAWMKSKIASYVRSGVLSEKDKCYIMGSRVTHVNLRHRSYNRIIII